MNIFDIFDGILDRLEKESDYIVQHGVSGRWEFLKTSGGLHACWGRIDFSYKAGTAWLGGYWHETEQVSFPSGLFDANPRTLITESDAVLTAIVGQTTTTSGLKVYVLNGTGGTGNVSLNVFAIQG